MSINNNLQSNKIPISVIVPIYNVEKYIHECVDSILSQTFKDFELILVDDGSPDNCPKICDDYAKRDSRVKVIHKKNGGLGSARNVGMDNASSKYIVFLDSDDYLDENALSVLYGEAEKNSLQILQFSGEPFLDGEPTDESLACSYTHISQNNIVKDGISSFKNALEHNEYFASSCMRFYLLEFLRENNFRFDEGIIHEDESFSFLAYITAERVECIGDRFYKRRYHDGSIMTTKNIQNSLYGYSVAMNTILSAFLKKSDESFKESEKELFILRIKVYLNFIRREYAILRKNGDISKVSFDDIQKNINKLSAVKPFLSKYEATAINSLENSYKQEKNYKLLVWFKVRIFNIIRFFKGTEK